MQHYRLALNEDILTDILLYSNPEVLKALLQNNNFVKCLNGVGKSELLEIKKSILEYTDHPEIIEFPFFSDVPMSSDILYNLLWNSNQQYNFVAAKKYAEKYHIIMPEVICPTKPYASYIHFYNITVPLAEVYLEYGFNRSKLNKEQRIEWLKKTIWETAKNRPVLALLCEKYNELVKYDLLCC